MKKICLEITAFILFVVILVSSIGFLNHALLPERTNYGSTWSMYDKEQRDSIDVMFFGSSIVFCDIVPAKIYEKTGITSYICAAPECTVPTMYYYIKEALKTQSPEVIFVELTGMYFNEYTNFTDVAVGYMPYNLNRLEATFNAAEPEARTGLLFPLYNYHTRWNELLRNNYFDRSDRQVDIWAGYTLLSTAKVQESIQTRNVDMTKVNFQKNIEYVEKIKDLCNENGVKLEFFIAPSCWRYSNENVEKIRTAAGDFAFSDFNEKFEQIGFDLNSDFFDFFHLNSKGAFKFSEWLGTYIDDKYSPASHNHDTELWDRRVKKLPEALAPFENAQK